MRYALDLRVALRKLFRQPVFSLGVILVVALGVGVGTTLFTGINALFLTAPPLVQNHKQLVRLNPRAGQLGANGYPNYEYYRDNLRVFSDVIGYDGAPLPAQYRTAAGLGDADVRFVTGNYFNALGVSAAAGRVLTPRDDAKAADNAVVLSAPFASAQFGSARAALGANLTLNGHAFTVVGVLPAAFVGVGRDDPLVDAWVPVWKRPLVTGRPELDMVRTPGYVHTFLVVIGRLRPGTTVAQAQANADALALQLARSDSTAQPGLAVSKDFALRPELRELMGTMMKLAGGLALLVLLLVCANLANLMLAQTVSRRPELAVRMALGANRWRVVRPLVLESLVLALAGGLVGFLFAVWSSHALAGFASTELAASPRPNLRVFAAALGLATLVGALFGSAPALIARRITVQTSGARTTEGGSRLRTILVVTQVALSFVLLVGAALFVRTLANVHAVDLGFRTDGVLIAAFDVRASGYNDTTGPDIYRRLLERTGRIPGVRSAALGAVLPLSGSRRTGAITVPGYTPPPGEEPLIVDVNTVTPTYLQTLDIRLLRGRNFTDADVMDAPSVTIVNETMARRFWPGQDPIGKVIARGRSREYQVIGLMRDTRSLNATDEPVAAMYTAFAQSYGPRAQLYLHTTGDPAALIPQLRAAVVELDPMLTIRRVSPMSAIYEQGIRTFIINARLGSILGVLALILASVGLYAVTAFGVARRTREFGLRMAVGAQPADVLRNVLRSAMERAVLGVGVGLLAAFALVRLLERFLFQLSPRDIGMFTVAGLALTAALLLASLVPALRATRVDPVTALRAD